MNVSLVDYLAGSKVRKLGGLREHGKHLRSGLCFSLAESQEFDRNCCEDCLHGDSDPFSEITQTKVSKQLMNHATGQKVCLTPCDLWVEPCRHSLWSFNLNNEPH